MPPVRMTFVDAEDGRPVAGANALFQATGREGTWTGHGGRTASLFAVEGVTDESGRLSLPAQEFSAQPFFLNTNLENASLVVLKPGYAMLVLTNNRRAVPERRDLEVWEYNDQTIKLQRATPEDANPNVIYMAASYAKRTMGEKSFCAWRKIPRFLLTLDRLAGEWSGPHSHPDEAVRRLTSSPLQQLLMNDQLYVDKGCGSPKAFFERVR
jgi:hypothetical protein